MPVCIFGGRTPKMRDMTLPMTWNAEERDSPLSKRGGKRREETTQSNETSKVKCMYVQEVEESMEGRIMSQTPWDPFSFPFLSFPSSSSYGEEQEQRLSTSTRFFF
jgi:hypothetical protein